MFDNPRADYMGGGGVGVGSRRFKARLQVGGIEYYLGRFSTAKLARLREAEAREEIRRTGGVTSVSVRYLKVPVTDHGDLYLWYWSHFEAGQERERSFAESLMVGVARDAVIDRLSSRKSSERAEARRWILSDSRHLFSFATICEYYSIDVTAARESLLGEG